MKISKIFNLGLLLFSIIQAYPQKLQKITQEQYLNYFPESLNRGFFYPNTNTVFILPTNEKDKTLQEETIKFYHQEFIEKLKERIIPTDTLIILTDLEALAKDLSKFNIYALGTIEGNLWISQFIKNSTDFPFRFYNDSIIADKTYLGNDMIFYAIWYNPQNPQHMLCLNIPQLIEYANQSKMYEFGQFWISKNKKLLNKLKFYQLRNSSWAFTEERDSTLFQFKEATTDYYKPYKAIDEENFIYKYPTIDELRNCNISQQDILCDTINLMQDACSFSNFNDMQWLKEIALNNNLVCIGEKHYLKQNTYLLKRILFALNTFNYYPVLVCEMPYSWAEYFNFYILNNNDIEASQFKDSVLNVIFDSFIPTLDCIRAWNKNHPQKKIQIACADLEHDMQLTIANILNPYFRKIELGFNFQFEERYKNYDEYFEIAQSILEKGKLANIQGDYPFQTYDYYGNVIENLKATFSIKLNPDQSNEFTERCKIMIRNLTDTSYLGNLLIKNKCVFYGGSVHFNILNKHDSIFKQTEGYYLANKFEPTKGKVYTIELRPLAYSIDDTIQRIDPRLNYRLETTLIQLAGQGLIKLNEPIISGIVDEPQKYFYKLSYQYPNYAFRSAVFEYPPIYNKYIGRKRFLTYNSLIVRYNNAHTTIYIPKACIGYD